MKRALAVTIALVIGVLVLSASTTALARELVFRSSDLPALLTRIFPAHSIQPPFKIEVWVQSVYGLEAEGERIRLKDCLRQQLHALGDVQFVDFLSTLPTASALRMRVWFTKQEKPDPYNCFDITAAVVIGKIDPDNPMKEIVIDSFAVAGIADDNLFALCEKIVERLDLRILSQLRKRSAPVQKQ